MTRVMLLRMSYCRRRRQALRKFEGLKRRPPTGAGGTVPVHLSVRDKAGKRRRDEAGRPTTPIDPNKVIVDELEQILGQGNVLFTK